MVEIETEPKCFSDAYEKVTKDSRHQSMDSVNIVKPIVACSKGKTVEDEHVVEVETEAKCLIDAQGKVTEDSRHQSIESINIVEPNEICSKG